MIELSYSTVWPPPRPWLSLFSLGLLAMQRDYIMRLIERIAALVASIVAKERAGQYPEARAEVDVKSREVIGMGLGDLRKLSPEVVSQLLTSSGGLRYGRAVILAELLLHDAAIADATDHASDALLSRVHAFCLLSDTIDTLTTEDQAIYREKLDTLAAQLRTLPPDAYLSPKLAAYDARPKT